MNICCTKKLLEELAIKPSAPQLIDPFFSWHANFMLINRKKSIVLVHDASRYAVILYGLHRKDLGNPDQLIRQAIGETLLAEGVNPEIADDYFQGAGAFCFTKTNGAKLVSWLNKGCATAEMLSKYCEDSTVVQAGMARKSNSNIFMNLKDQGAKHPNEVFYAMLQERFNKPAIRCKAVKIKATLLLGRFEVWREAVVPLRFTFAELHEVMQMLFNWHDCHMHDFIGLNEDGPVASIVPQLDDFEAEDNQPALFERAMTLEEYLPQYTRIIYRYDFGDSWEHLIEIQEILPDYDKYYASCVDGKGDTPPEDVGGETGYEDFVEIMANPRNPEYAEMKAWALEQWYQPFSLESVNWQLKHRY